MAMETKQLRMNIDKEKHAQLKALVALEGKTIKDVMEELIDNYLQEKSKKYEIKKALK